jgi:iron(III) transport system substrate-binding protein
MFRSCALLAILAFLVSACGGSPAPTQGQAPAAPAAKPAEPAAKPAEPAAKPAEQPAAKPAASGEAVAVTPRFSTDKQTLEAAKKEGKVIYYTARTQADAEAIAKRFEELTGIKVEVTRLSAGPQFDRVMREQQAGLKVTDVVDSGLEPNFLIYKERGMLQPYQPREASKIDSAYRDKDQMYHVPVVVLQFICYNPRVISAAEAPKSWKDIYDPKWKGKLALAHPNYSGIVNEWLYWQSQLYGWEILDKLKANQPFIGRSLGEVIPPLVSGERPLGAECWSDPAWQAKRQGQPIEIVYPSEGVMANTNPVAILKTAPNPNAAKVLVDFLFSLENQQWLAGRYVYVTHPEVTYPTDLAGFKPLKELKTVVVDPNEVKKELQSIRDRFADRFGG